ncbi:MAG TPA: hypothetical protein VLZ54_03765, partial [Arenibacter sp.]|nr:hypothetical protein [Arenibacter sp.]
MIKISVLISLLIYGSALVLMYRLYKTQKGALYFIGLVLLLLASIFKFGHERPEFIKILLLYLLPLQVLNLGFLIYSDIVSGKSRERKRFRVRFGLVNGRLVLGNIRRGVSIIGSAGSGKTESVVYNFLKHFSANEFSGVIHDYKDMEIT